MMSFLKKDFLLLKANIKIFIVACFAYIFMLIFSETGVSIILPFLVMLVYISTFNYDDVNNWNAYASTLPCGRKSAIQGKYLGTIIALLLSLVIAIPSEVIISAFKSPTVSVEEILASFLLTVTFISIFISIAYPLIYKLGVEKGRICTGIALMGLYLLLLLVIKIVGFDAVDSFLTFFDKWQYLFVPLICICAFIISYFASIKIYFNKEF